MKTYGGVEVQLQDSLNSVLDAGEWSALLYFLLNSGDIISGAHRIGGWVCTLVD
jgi:hypothetical protein